MYVSNTIIQTSLRCNSASVITTCLYVSSKYNTASVWRICASVTAICVYDLCQCVSVILVYYISDCLTREFYYLTWTNYQWNLKIIVIKYILKIIPIKYILKMIRSLFCFFVMSICVYVCLFILLIVWKYVIKNRFSNIHNNEFFLYLEYNLPMSVFRIVTRFLFLLLIRPIKIIPPAI